MKVEHQTYVTRQIQFLARHVFDKFKTTGYLKRDASGSVACFWVEGSSCVLKSCTGIRHRIPAHG